MHTIDIFHRDGTALATIKPDDNSVQSTQIMGEDVLRVSFQDTRTLPFAVGDYCDVFGTRYTLNALPVVHKAGPRLYEYTLQLEAPYADLAKVQYLFLNPANSLREGDFALMGNPDTFIDLLLQNAARYGGGWTKGQVISGPFKALDFKGDNCYNVLSRLAEEFDTEFWIEGRTIHLTKRRHDTPLLFKVGRYQGLYELTRTNFNNSSVVNRLYVYGSEKNLPADYRNGLKRLSLPGGGVVLEDAAAIAAQGLSESVQFFDDVYPHRTGRVSAVNAANPFQFVDSLIDFDVNSYLLPGLTAQVTFNTGQLAGYTFKVSSYNHGAKTFTILKNEYERVTDVPNSSMRPAIGDLYVITDIKMPQSYLDVAEAALQDKAQAMLDVVKKPQYSYTVAIDPVHVANYGIALRIGDEVTIQDAALGIDTKIRVSKVTRGLVNEHDYQVELSDLVTPSTLTRILSAQYEADRGLQQLQATFQSNALLNGNVIGSLNFSNLPVAPGTVGFVELVMETLTGKLFRKA